MVCCFTKDFKLSTAPDPLTEEPYAYYSTLEEFITALGEARMDTSEATEELPIKNGFVFYREANYDSYYSDKWETVSNDIQKELEKNLPIEEKEKIKSIDQKKEQVTLPRVLAERFTEIVALYDFCGDNDYSNEIFLKMAEVILNA